MPSLPDPLPNLALPTFGGLQFWSDVDLRDGWRVQQHAITGHHRLIDADDVRRAWGSRAACAAELDQLGPPRVPRAEIVMLIHGLGRTHHSLAELEASLRERGHHTEHLRYATTRLAVREHAEHLADWLDAQADVERVSFVTHSLGGHVVRDALSFREAGPDRPEIGGVVMLAPPARGAAMADLVGGVPPARWVFGPALQDLSAEASASLPAPTAPFGIVAAGRGTEDGLNPFIPGDDDGVVGVDETLLPGATDVLIVRGTHTFLMDDEEVQAAVDRFLRTRSFER